MTHRPLRQWLVAAAVAVTMASTGTVHAAGALRTVPSHLEKADASKYAEGKRAYEKQDYAAAGKTFTALLGRVPESPANRTIRASLVLDAMAAYQAAYEGSGGPFFLGPKPSYADFHWFPWAHRLARCRMMLNSGYHKQHRLGVLKHYRNFSVPSTPEFAGNTCSSSITTRKISSKRCACVQCPALSVT